MSKNRTALPDASISSGLSLDLRKKHLNLVDGDSNRRTTRRTTPETIRSCDCKALTFIRDNPGCRVAPLVPFRYPHLGKVGPKIMAAYVTQAWISAGWVRKKTDPTRYWLTKKGAASLAALIHKPADVSGISPDQ